MLAAMTFSMAQASGTADIMGQPYVVDTLFYNQVGPGTTQTTLWLHNGTTNQRVFYTTIDLNDSYVALECILGRAPLPQFQTLESMARHHTSEGHQPFIGTNGDFGLVTQEFTRRGAAMYGTPLGTTICDGLIQNTQPATEGYPSFVAAVDRQVYISPLTYRGTLTAPNGEQTTASAIISSARGSG